MKTIIFKLRRVLVLSAVLALFISTVQIPVLAGNASEASAGQEIEHSLKVIEIDPQEVPLSGSIQKDPQESSETGSVLWVVIVAVILVFFFLQLIYYLKFRDRVNSISGSMSKEEKKSLNDKSYMFHPLKREEMADDIENDLASKYL